MGIIESIHIAETAGGAMYAIPTATLIAGKGIEGDRYASLKGTFSDYVKDHELTLVEAEVAEELGFVKQMVGRGGLRAIIVEGGTVKLGDAVTKA